MLGLQLLEVLMPGRPALIEDLWVLRPPGEETQWVATWSGSTAEGARAAGWEVLDVSWLRWALTQFAAGKHTDRKGMLLAQEALGDQEWWDRSAAEASYVGAES
jgi:hypothetical protein